MHLRVAMFQHGPTAHDMALRRHALMLEFVRRLTLYMFEAKESIRNFKYQASVSDRCSACLPRRSCSRLTHCAAATDASVSGAARHNGAFQPFELEKWQSRWEYDVEVNLADSGVQPVRLEELVRTPEALQVGKIHISSSSRC